MRYVFLVKARGYGHDVRIADLSNPDFRAKIICSSSFEQLLAACSSEISEGAQVVELCGGFTNKEADNVKKLLGSMVAVGHVQFNEAGLAKLAQLGFGN